MFEDINFMDNYNLASYEVEEEDVAITDAKPLPVATQHDSPPA